MCRFNFKDVIDLKWYLQIVHDRYNPIPGPRIHIAHPYMDLWKSTIIQIKIHDLWMSVFNSPYKCEWIISTLISKQGYPCKNLLQWMSVELEYPRMDIDVIWISVFSYPSFYCPIRYSLISMDIHAWTCYGFSILGWETYNPKKFRSYLKKIKINIFLKNLSILKASITAYPRKSHADVTH